MEDVAYRPRSILLLPCWFAGGEDVRTARRSDDGGITHGAVATCVEEEARGSPIREQFTRWGRGSQEDRDRLQS